MAPEGDIDGLFDKLQKLDVLDVKDYQIYEGSASFTLLLKNGKSLSLSAINNQDLISSESIVITGINGSEIYCRSKSGSYGEGGISVTTIKNQLLAKTY